MKDLTLLYYTSDVAWPEMTRNVRKHLLEITEGKLPIISVSQKPLDFGNNVCVGLIGQSYYNAYKQMLIGALKVKTKYIACVEDDTLYSMEHFAHRPPKDTFSFNTNMWYTEEDYYFNKYDHGMCTCIVETETLINTLRPRFIKYPTQPESLRMQRYFQEPGRDDMKFGIPNAKVELFKTKIPILTFNFFAGLGGKKISREHTPIVEIELEPWGNCLELKKHFWGR
jgi:hypothetical protein